MSNEFDYAKWLRELPDWLDSNREPHGGVLLSKKVLDQTNEILRAAAVTLLDAPPSQDNVAVAEIVRAVLQKHYHGEPTVAISWKWADVCTKIAAALNARSLRVCKGNGGSDCEDDSENTKFKFCGYCGGSLVEVKGDEDGN